MTAQERRTAYRELINNRAALFTAEELIELAAMRDLTENLGREWEYKLLKIQAAVDSRTAAYWRNNPE